VKGYITIDNENYVIERRLNRKKSKNGEYTVTSKLEFFKIDDNQQIVNLTGEQRRETETFITSAIGTEEDFLATILTTGYNLEQLIESKPTARGQILSKFLGLDTLKQKEEIAKEIYNEWSKKLVSNSYNIVELEKQIFSNDELIASTKKELFDTNKKLSENENQLKKYEKEKDNLLLKRNNDIDKDLLNINTDFLKSTIEDLKKNKVEIIKKIGSVSLVEPSEYYLESEYNTISKNIEKFNFERYKHKETISQKEKNIKSLVEGLVCPTCNRKLDEIDHTDEINKLKNELIELKKVDYDTKINELQEQFNKQVKLKNDYDTYEKNKLIVEKYKLELEQKDLDIEKKENSLNNYYKNESKLNENKKIDQELIKVKTNIETLNGEIRQLNNNITKHQTGIKILNDKSTNYQELIKKIKIEQDTVQIFKVYFTVYGKNGITKVIMKNMIPLINSELYRLLVDSCYFILELNINDKNEVEFIMIDTETRIVKPLSAGSGYERTISSLALRSVLTKISSLPKPNVVVMDEVFGKIADENLEMVGEFFKKIKNYFEQIFIISHNPLIRNWSDNVIVIKKEDNVSSIEYIKKISINL
jgi:DNA repair exonuclease SbcCD ATPase subunit